MIFQETSCNANHEYPTRPTVRRTDCVILHSVRSKKTVRPVRVMCSIQSVQSRGHDWTVKQSVRALSQEKFSPMLQCFSFLNF